MEPLITFYHAMPGGIQYIMNFIFTVLIMRGIVANELMKEFQKFRKWFKKKYIEFGLTGNRAVITSHYNARSVGNGHKTADFLACNEPQCYELRLTT